jgi:hypothetical protein
MTSHKMDAHPIKPIVLWLADEAGSIPRREKHRMERSMSELNDLKARIAAGEYRLDAHAIADAMFGRADRELAAARGSSEVLEAGDVDGPAGGVDQL